MNCHSYDYHEYDFKGGYQTSSKEEAKKDQHALDLMEKIGKCTPYLRARLKQIEDNRQSLLLSDDVENIQFWLTLTKEVRADCMYGVDTLEIAYEDIINMSRKYPVIIDEAISEAPDRADDEDAVSQVISQATDRSEHEDVVSQGISQAPVDLEEEGVSSQSISQAPQRSGGEELRSEVDPRLQRNKKSSMQHPAAASALEENVNGLYLNNWHSLSARPDEKRITETSESKWGCSWKPDVSGMRMGEPSPEPGRINCNSFPAHVVNMGRGRGMSVRSLEPGIPNHNSSPSPTQSSQNSRRPSPAYGMNHAFKSPESRNSNFVLNRNSSPSPTQASQNSGRPSPAYGMSHAFKSPESRNSNFVSNFNGFEDTSTSFEPPCAPSNPSPDVNFRYSRNTEHLRPPIDCERNSSRENSHFRNSYESSMAYENHALTNPESRNSNFISNFNGCDDTSTSFEPSCTRSNPSPDVNLRYSKNMDHLHPPINCERNSTRENSNFLNSCESSKMESCTREFPSNTTNFRPPAPVDSFQSQATHTQRNKFQNFRPHQEALQRQSLPGTFHNNMSNGFRQNNQNQFGKRAGPPKRPRARRYFDNNQGIHNSWNNSQDYQHPSAQQNHIQESASHNFPPPQVHSVPEPNEGEVPDDANATLPDPQVCEPPTTKNSQINPNFGPRRPGNNKTAFLSNLEKRDMVERVRQANVKNKTMIQKPQTQNTLKQDLRNSALEIRKLGSKDNNNPKEATEMPPETNQTVTERVIDPKDKETTVAPPKRSLTPKKRKSGLKTKSKPPHKADVAKEGDESEQEIPPKKKTPRKSASTPAKTSVDVSRTKAARKSPRKDQVKIKLPFHTSPRARKRAVAIQSSSESEDDEPCLPDVNPPPNDPDEESSSSDEEDDETIYLRKILNSWAEFPPDEIENVLRDKAHIKELLEIIERETGGSKREDSGRSARSPGRDDEIGAPSSPKPDRLSILKNLALESDVSSDALEDAALNRKRKLEDSISMDPTRDNSEVQCEPPDKMGSSPAKKRGRASGPPKNYAVPDSMFKNNKKVKGIQPAFVPVHQGFAKIKIEPDFFQATVKMEPESPVKQFICESFNS